MKLIAARDALTGVWVAAERRIGRQAETCRRIGDDNDTSAKYFGVSIGGVRVRTGIPTPIVHQDIRVVTPRGEALAGLGKKVKNGR